MIAIEYPPYQPKIKVDNNTEYIFDSIRNKWIVLTPEEWVRQNFIKYLVGIKKYPSSLIATEKELKLGELKKRFDILVYDTNHMPWLMVECKSMEIKLDEAVLQQVIRYNISIPVKFLVITNGSNCFAWEKKDGQLVPCSEIPEMD